MSEENTGSPLRSSGPPVRRHSFNSGSKTPLKRLSTNIAGPMPSSPTSPTRSPTSPSQKSNPRARATAAARKTLDFLKTEELIEEMGKIQLQRRFTIPSIVISPTEDDYLEAAKKMEVDQAEGQSLNNEDVQMSDNDNVISKTAFPLFKDSASGGLSASHRPNTKANRRHIFSGHELKK